MNKVPGLIFWTLLCVNLYDGAESSDVDVALITNSGIDLASPLPGIVLLPLPLVVGMGIESLICKFADEVAPLLLLLLGFCFTLEPCFPWRLTVGSIPEKSSGFFTGVEEVLLAGEFELLLLAYEPCPLPDDP